MVPLSSYYDVEYERLSGRNRRKKDKIIDTIRIKKHPTSV